MRKSPIPFVETPCPIEGIGPCHVCPNKPQWQGYVQFKSWPNGKNGKCKNTMAHRLAYELSKGPIPTGLVIDHICRVRKCVNPSHLRAITPRQNVFENSQSPSYFNSLKTHCKRGHEFTPANTCNTKDARRSCRTCMKMLQRDFYLKNRDKINERRRAR